VTDTLSRCVKELPDPTELFGFKTTEFTGEEHREFVMDVEQNLANLLRSRNHPINISFTDHPEIEEALCNAIQHRRSAFLHFVRTSHVLERRI